MTERMKAYRNFKKHQSERIRAGCPEDEAIEMMVQSWKLEEQLTDEDWNSIPEEVAAVKTETLIFGQNPACEECAGNGVTESLHKHGECEKRK